VSNLRLKRFDEAEKEYIEAIRINPNHVTAHENLGLLLWQVGRKNEAEEYFNKLLTLRPDARDWIEEIKRS
jgi:tetratricopeptide (TPR) repeat protein